MNIKIEDVRVYVYRLGTLSKTLTFKSLSSAHRFIENAITIGYMCIMQRLDNGRPWATIKYWPKESI